MAKKTAFVPKEPIAKLPLAVRKDLRDNFDAKKEEFESKITELVGVEKFTINFNPNLVWAYAEESRSTRGYTNCGKTLADYADGFISGLTEFVNKYGDEGKKDFVKHVTAAELALDVHPLGPEAPEVIDAEIKDGVWTILFKHDCLGYNVSRIAADACLRVIDSARTEGFSLKAKADIDEYYTDKIDDLKEEIGKLLNMEDVILDPNFEEIYDSLKKTRKKQNWEERFGRSAYEYFEGMKNELNNNNFAEDDMLQEGFAEAVPSKTVKLRIVEKMKGWNVCEPVLEDDVLYLQTVADNWGANTLRSAEGLVKLM